ncbi:MAG: serine/threonine protein kinase [Marmoricola sp.]|nr:serine/threonine protein kinase [Marmoricola sp.]
MSSPQEPLRTTSVSTERLDPAFVFEFRAYDEPGPGQRWSTWYDVEPLCRAPEPRPDWVITHRAAVDTELGILKTGKEADVFLLERAVDGGPAVVMAAKRYRSTDHRNFHRNSAYTEGRRGRDSREARAAAKGSSFGRLVAAGQWAGAEWDSLKRCWALGLPVPYPVQLDGTEILMEWVQVDGDTAPRLAQTRPDPDLLASYFDQLREAIATMAQHGIVHGDLSAYNILAAGERLVIIDLPQVVDLVGNPQGMDFLLRDCANICAWFRSKGLAPAVADEHALFGDLLATAF